MAPRRRADKGKAPMVEEEPVGRRTRSRTTGVVIQEAQTETSHDEQVAGLTQTEQEEVMVGPEIAPGEPELAKAERPGSVSPDRTTASPMQTSVTIPQFAVMMTMMAAMVQDLRDFLQSQNKKRSRDNGPGRPKEARTDSSGTTSSGKFCRFCKRHGHVMSECRRLQARHSRDGAPRPTPTATGGYTQGSSQPRRQGPRVSSTCYLCGEVGHFQSNCPRLGRKESGTSSAAQPREQSTGCQIGRGQAPRDLFTCYLCGEPGHFRRGCPRLGKTENVTTQAPRQLARGGGYQEAQTVEEVITVVQATNAQETQPSEDVSTGNLRM